MQCTREEMWKRVFEAWYSVAQNVLEELNNSMARRIADFIKGIDLSKALTCMKLFLYKQKLLFFIKGTDIFGHIVVWTIYTFHIDHIRPNIQLLNNPQHAYQSF